MHDLVLVIVTGLICVTVTGAVIVICSACVKINEAKVTEALEKEKLWQATRSTH
jgi:hypothetical protein